MSKIITNKTWAILLLAVSMLQLGAFQTTASAQEKELPSVGKVLDQANNPIQDVTISVKGESGSVPSIANGSFFLECKVGDVLIFSHPEYLYKEVKIGNNVKGQETLIVHMTEKKHSSSKPIVGPYGKEQSSNSFLGAASTVYTEDLIKTHSSNILAGIQGRLAGLNIAQTRGNRLTTNSDNSQFGYNSRGNAPVIIVDGIERDLVSIDPESIESISIQKDALSSMFLGMQSSRGALIITTKTPSKGDFHLSFTGQAGVQTPINMPKALSASQYSYLLNEALLNEGNTAFYSYDDYNKYANGSDGYLHPNINWYDQLMNQNASTQSYNMNVSGGGKVAQYFINLGFYTEDGLFRTDENNSYNTNFKFNRYSISSKVNINITDNLSATVTALARLQEGNQPGGNGDGYNNLLNTIYTTPNNAYPIKNPNGTWGGTLAYTNNLLAQTMHSGYIRNDSRDVMGTLNLKYDFSNLIEGLTANLIGNVSNQSFTTISRVKRTAVYEMKMNGGKEQYTMYGSTSPQSNNFSSISNYLCMYGQFALDYDRTFSDHRVNVNLSADTRTEMVNNDLPMIPSNIMARAEYSYLDKYFVQAAFTESYFNRYAPGKQWGNFYAAGLGWDVSKEGFMENAEWLDQLKIRATYGKTGNGISNSGYYTYRQTFEQNAASWYPQGTLMSISFITRELAMANPNITWEKAQKFNIGLDLGLLNNRLQLNADFYQDNYYDILLTRGKSIELIGSSYPTENIGESWRRGADISLYYQDKIGAFNFYIGGNWNIEENQWTYKDEQDVPFEYLSETGRPIGSIFGLVADGFLTAQDIANGYPVISGYENIQAGDLKYVDMNSDGVIDDFDRTVIGGDKPIAYFGLDLGFEVKGLEFSMLWQGSYNRDIQISDRTLTEGFQSTGGTTYGQAYELLLSRWTPETADSAQLPRIAAGGNNYNQQASSFWIKSGNFFRLKNVSLAYNLPENFCRKALGGLRIKVFANGQNLFTQSACNWVDPEVTFINSPLQRTVTMGINVKF